MKPILRKALCLTLLICLVFSVAACSKPASNTKNDRVIKLGTLSINEVLMKSLKDKLISRGYKVELIMFDANNMPAIATRDGDLDGFIHNHLPWIETFNKENNARLVMVKPYLFHGRTGLYSLKYKSLAEIPNGARIAVPNDPTNLDKSLLMLQDLGLIKLKPKTDNFHTELDIIENPKNIKLVGTEISVTARSINDADAVICPAARIKQGGIDPNSFLAEDPESVNFPTGLTVDAKSLDEAWVKDAMEILGSDEMRAQFEQIYGGANVLYPKQ